MCVYVYTHIYICIYSVPKAVEALGEGSSRGVASEFGVRVTRVCPNQSADLGAAGMGGGMMIKTSFMA